MFFVGRGLNTKINPITADAETKWLVRVSLTYFSVSLLKKWKSCLPQLSIIRYWYCSHIVIIWNTTFFHVPNRFVCIVNLKFMFNELLFSDNFLNSNLQPEYLSDPPVRTWPGFWRRSGKPAFSPTLTEFWANSGLEMKTRTIFQSEAPMTDYEISEMLRDIVTCKWFNKVNRWTVSRSDVCRMSFGRLIKVRVFKCLQDLK